MSITTTSFSANTLIKSADVNTNFTNITTAIPWSSNPIAAKGDILAGTAASAASALSVGTDGQVLTADSSQAKGVKWASPASAPTALINMQNVGFLASVAASALTFNLTQADGSSTPTSGSPCYIGFRSSTITTSGYNQRSVTSALSVVVPSSATLGTSNSVPARIYLYALDNAGTVELAVAGSQFSESELATTTTISSGATSATTLYSTTGRSSVPIKLIGWISITETSAGTWAAGPSSAYLNLPTLPSIPKITVYKSGSGTHTTDAKTRFMRVKMVGGGGGGAASASGTGGNGGDTTFGTSLLTASGGTGGSVAANGPAGGGFTVNSPAIDIGSFSGENGSSAIGGSTGSFGSSGDGGSSVFGGRGVRGRDNAVGSAAKDNTGSGGGGGTAGTTNANNGAGGAAGGYVYAHIGFPDATYAYSVGAKGSGGSGSGNAGGDGAAGIIIVEEY